MNTLAYDVHTLTRLISWWRLPFGCLCASGQADASDGERELQALEDVIVKRKLDLLVCFIYVCPCPAFSLLCLSMAT